MTSNLPREYWLDPPDMAEYCDECGDEADLRCDECSLMFCPWCLTDETSPTICKRCACVQDAMDRVL